MNEEFVTFELAKKLKEKGFDWKTRCGYLPPIKFIHESFTDKDWIKLNGYSAPTIAQVLKWLRKEKNIHIEIRIFNICYGFDIYNINPKNKVAWSGTIEYKTYEEAAIVGIEYVLDVLI